MSRHFFAPDSIQNYARQLCARWLPRLLAAGVSPCSDEFFKCMEVCGYDLPHLLQDLEQSLQKLSRNRATRAYKMLREIMEDDDPGEYDIRRLLKHHPKLVSPMEACIRRALDNITGKADFPRHDALMRLESFFGLDTDCQHLAEFAFATQQYTFMRSFFSHKLELWNHEHQSLLAKMLDMSPGRLSACRETLYRCGIVDEDGDLRSSLTCLWDANGPDPRDLFIRPLKGDTLPLGQFCLPPGDVELVRDLFSNPGDAPLHLLLYGPPGTGKSTFARSLARECGLKGWAVTSRLRDDDDDRRTSFAACLHVAARHRNGFVLVDEAERLLDTDRTFGRRTKDKAWLNDLLETPGQRIIWITNQVEHIDPAVRRRFTYSLYFKELDKKARADIWQQVLTRQKASRRLEADQVARLAATYPVAAAVINDAVCLSKRLHRGKKGFAASIENIIQAHLRLQHDGASFKPVAKYAPDKHFTLDGVCMEGSAGDLLHTLKRLDAALRGKAGVRPGSANLLFYGPPGTGKTELARHIAQELDRPCEVVRASDIVSPFVGMTERNIARAFEMAGDEGSVLVIDEADTFLYSRDTAQRSWETSEVNEFLTALENSRGFCICTTNHKVNMDAAAMRRFTHKIAFTYASPEQVLALYTSLLAPLCGVALPVKLERRLRALSHLTPGDFRAVYRQFDPLYVEPQSVTHEKLVDALEREVTLKNETLSSSVGF